MNKPGRNEPCPCGSGDKYKRCCLQKDHAASAARLAQAAAEQRHAEQAAHEAFEASQALDAASNAALHLIRAGQLDAAEAAARELLVRYPEVHDGYDRLGMVYEARGQKAEAAACYRKVLEFARAHPGQYDEEFVVSFKELIEELDPPTATTS